MEPVLTLASASPRRKRLLEQAGVALVVAPVLVDETPSAREAPTRYAQRLAEAKARAAAARADPAAVVLAADTVVHRDGVIYDKPASREDATRTLAGLSGVWHEVTTAYAVCQGEELLASAQVSTRVRFRRLSAADIERYLDTGEALDKAGAYGIQGQGGALVDRVEGSYTNIVGLPLAEVLEVLRPLGLLDAAAAEPGPSARRSL